jgi:oxygen-independent coproporphyrinogen-3 oxidase
LGFEAYEVSNFCRPGHQCRHNLAYWNGTPFLGLGPGAHSYLPTRGAWGTRYWNDASLDAYLRALEIGNRPPGNREALTREQALLERLFLDLRRPVALVPVDLAEFFALDRENVEKVFRELTDRDLLRPVGGGAMVPTWEGMRRADGLALAAQGRLLEDRGSP